MTREALVSAYRYSVGGHGIERKNGELNILGVVKQEVPKEEQERFLRHGIANINLPAGDFAKVAFLVDTADLPSQVTGYWFTPGEEEFSLHLSNGKQPSKENIQSFDPKRQLEGVYIITVSQSRDGTNNSYIPKVFPLYSPLRG